MLGRWILGEMVELEGKSSHLCILCDRPGKGLLS